MKKYNKIVFVCTGNTCRSPMAEAIYKKFDEEIEVLSRGIVVLFSEPINPKAEIILNNHNFDLPNHKAKGLEEDDMGKDSLVLTMTEDHKDRVKKHFKNSDNVYTIKEFAGENGDVIDPYGKSLVDYEECYEELAKLSKKAFHKINDNN